MDAQVNLFLKQIKKTGNDWYLLEHAPYYLIDNEKLILKAVSKEPDVLQYASDRLKNHPKIVLKALEKNSFTRNAIHHASQTLKNNKDFIRQILENPKYPNKTAFIYAPEEWKDDKSFVLKILKQDGNALEYVSTRLKNDHEVVIQAVTQNSFSIIYANKELKDCLNIVFHFIKSLKTSFSPMQYISPRLQKNKKIISFAVKQIDKKSIYFGYRHNCSWFSYELVSKLMKKKKIILPDVHASFQNNRLFIFLSNRYQRYII